MCLMECRCSLTLALSTNEPVAFSAGTGVAPCCVDADLGGVTVMRVCLTFINVWNREKQQRREREREGGVIDH